MAVLPNVQPERSARPSSRFSEVLRKRAGLPWGLVGSIALIVLIEANIVRFKHDTPTPATMSWRLSEAAARHEAVDCDVLVFGDSLIKHGLNARVFQESTGLKTYNLSVCACQAPANVVLLNRALDAGAKPRAVILEAAPDLMAGKPLANVRNWPELLEPSEAVALAWKTHDATLCGRILLAEALPSYRARLEIRKLLSPPPGFDPHSKRESLRLAEHWTSERGSNVAGEHGAFDGHVTEEDHRTLLSDRFWCDRNNRGHLSAFLDAARARQIPVFWVLPPVSPAVQARRDASGAEAKHLAFVESLTRPYPDVRILNFQHAGFESTDFVDPRHMTGDASKRLTRQIAAIVADRLSKPAR